MSSRDPISIPRTHPHAPMRVLRLRADERLLTMLEPAPAGVSASARLSIPTREPVAVGDRVAVEMSLGPLVDEVVVAGVLRRTESRANQPNLAVIDLAPGHHSRLKYVVDVIKGDRQPNTRRHRRFPARLGVRWWWGMRPHNTHATELSAGGAFVHCRDEPPQVGFPLELELRLDTRKAPLRIPGRVRWTDHVVREGFGMVFHLRDRQLARQVMTVMKHYEQTTPPVLWG